MSSKFNESVTDDQKQDQLKMEVSIVKIPKKDPRNLRNSSTTSVVENNNQPLKNRVKSAQKNNNLSVV